MSTGFDEFWSQRVPRCDCIASLWVLSVRLEYSITSFSQFRNFSMIWSMVILVTFIGIFKLPQFLLFFGNWEVMNLFLIVLLLFKYCCLHPLPTFPPIPAIPTSVPCFHPLGLVHVSFRIVPENPPSHLPSGYCQIVLNFIVSGYIFLACLFCWLGST